MIVGTAGHIDHGKTQLVKALTGTDRLVEENARGITIDLGFAYANLGGRAVTAFVDVPGHERVIYTMLAGAGGIDLAPLIAAADDGAMQQTQEHLAILDMLDPSQRLIALTKADLADPGRGAQVTGLIRAALADSGLVDAPIIPVSSLTGEGVDSLRDAMIKAEACRPSHHQCGLLPGCKPQFYPIGPGRRSGDDQPFGGRGAGARPSTRRTVRPPAASPDSAVR